MSCIFPRNVLDIIESYIRAVCEIYSDRCMIYPPWFSDICTRDLIIKYENYSLHSIPTDKEINVLRIDESIYDIAPVLEKIDTSQLKQLDLKFLKIDTFEKCVKYLKRPLETLRVTGHHKETIDDSCLDFAAKMMMSEFCPQKLKIASQAFKLLVPKMSQSSLKELFIYNSISDKNCHNTVKEILTVFPYLQTCNILDKSFYALRYKNDIRPELCNYVIYPLTINFLIDETTFVRKYTITNREIICRVYERSCLYMDVFTQIISDKRRTIFPKTLRLKITDVEIKDRKHAIQSLKNIEHLHIKSLCTRTEILDILKLFTGVCHLTLDMKSSYIKSILPALSSQMVEIKISSEHEFRDILEGMATCTHEGNNSMRQLILNIVIDRENSDAYEYYLSKYSEVIGKYKKLDRVDFIFYRRGYVWGPNLVPLELEYDLPRVYDEMITITKKIIPNVQRLVGCFSN